MRLKLIVPTLFATIGFAAATLAQTPDATFVLSGPPPMPMQTKAGTIGFQIDTMDAAPVKGAPFCATVSTEHTQHLADGNRIHTTETSQLCRDSEGRTRREAGLNLLGAAPATSAPKLITITDPVAGVRYLLDTENKIAQKMPLSADKVFLSAAVPDGGKGEHMVIMQRSGVQGVEFNDKTIAKKIGDENEDRNSENLGDQTIEGIHATGTRMTTVIPAGKMGNDGPITVTSERWYSPELKVAVMTKHDDPWAGELKTEFKNVTTTEPDASLFTVPGDYKIIVDDKDGPMRIKLSGPAAPPQ